MSKMHLDEFNPLDVLAAAATLQQTTHNNKPTSTDEDQPDDQLTTAAEEDDVPPKDKQRVQLRMPPRGGQSVDHSYAWSGSAALLQKAESTEDDGYCSRCSLDSPGQSSRSDVDTNDQDVFSDTDLRSPAAPSAFKSPILPPLSPKTVSKKSKAKIVILSRDANLKHLLTCPDANNSNNIINNNNNSACQEFSADEHFVEKSLATDAAAQLKPVHTVMEPVDSWAGCPDRSRSEDNAATAAVAVVETPVSPVEESVQEEPLVSEDQHESPIPEIEKLPPSEPSEESEDAPSTVDEEQPSPKKDEEEVEKVEAVTASESVKTPPPPPPPSTSAVVSSGNTIFIVRPVPSSSTANNRYIIHDDLPTSKSPPAVSASSSAASWQLLSTLDSKAGLVARSTQPASLLLTDKKPAPKQLSLLKTDSPRKQDYPSLLLVKHEDASGRASPSPMLSSAPILPTLNTDADKAGDSGKINIKISGSKVIDVSCSDNHSIAVKKQATSIGRLGSLSWQNIVDSEPSQVSRSATSSPFLLRTDSSGPSSPLSSTPAAQQAKRPYQRKNALKRSASVAGLNSLDGETAKVSCHTYVKKRKGKAWNPLSPTQHELSQMKLSAQAMLRLHPLIDHDYCMFSEFNAEIQSSIIATTETKLRTERKHGGKKAARTKSVKVPGALVVEKQVKRKYTKRKLKEASALQAALKEEAKRQVDVEQFEDEEKAKPPVLKVRKRLLHEKKLSCKYSPYKERPDKNYVKIPGSYQDDFVYYATRKSHKRIRKSPETLLELPYRSAAKAPSCQVGGINVFDWYREMAKVDKSKFGVSVNDKAYDEKALMSADKGNMMLNNASPPPESEMLDFVINMDSATSTDCNAAVEKVETVETSEEIDLMAEQVRSMLNSLNETDLRLLTENLGTNDAPAILGHGVATTTPLLGDLDDINDSDLISSDIGNDLNIMLGDLPQPSAAAAAAAAPVQPQQQQPIAKSSSSSGSIASVSPENAVPELTMVNMYWNDLPGLLIDGTEHVRLVDIHKQVLPAKDTGILKKRCQMMALPILNCSELQRDFLIRYMNAAKSKSCVITSKEHAKTLIGFYVDPRPRTAAPTRPNDEGETDEPEKPLKKRSPTPAASPLSLEQEHDDTEETTEEKLVDVDSVEQASSPACPPSIKNDTSGNSSSEPCLLPRASPASPRAPRPPQSPSNLKRSSRLRRTRKVSYAAMHNGSMDGDLLDASSSDAASSSSPPARVTVHLKTQQRALTADSPDEQEIRRLVGKRKKRALSKRETSRLHALRERVKKRRQKQKENLRVRLNKAKLKSKVLHDNQPAEHAYASWHAKLGAQNQRKQPPSPPAAEASEKQAAALQVTHRDDRHGHRGKVSQDGDLLLDLFQTREAACIACSVCRQRMSVKKFLKHAHRLSDPDELVAVTLPQKLQLSSCSPAAEEEAQWAQYLARSQRFEQQLKDKEVHRKKPATTPETKSHLHDPSSSSSPEVDALTRHSTRLRRRKQMHPMESYVFEAKRDRAEL